MLSRDRGARHGASLNDMEYYTDSDRAAWRAWMTIDELAANPRFAYRPGRFVNPIY